MPKKIQANALEAPKSVPTRQGASKKCPLMAMSKKSSTEAGHEDLDIDLSEEALKQLGSVSDIQKRDITLNALLRLSGTENRSIACFLIDSAKGALPEGKDLASSYNVLLQGLYEMGPRDVIEGMLCSQAIALYAQGMMNLRRSEQATYCDRAEAYMRQAVKLLRMNQETIEKLEKYRRKGQQTVQVEHVHVHQGGQAIVGTVTTGGGV